MSKRLKIIALICLISCYFVIEFQARQIILKNLKLYDKKNRQMTFHGTNIVVKVPPYIPITDHYDPTWSFSKEDIQDLRQNGFNAIRLGIMWAGLQPKKDWYNQTYLQQMVQIVNSAGQSGIYSIIEFHQDLLSQQFCGDGVPLWLMQQLRSYKTFPFPMGKKIHLNSSHLPNWTDCDTQNWGKYYFSYDVGQGFNDLYNLNHKLNHKFTAYWQKVARTFKNNPYVIAYQLINEPFIGNFWRNPLLVVPSMGQRLKLQSFYDNLSQKIRNIDPLTPICFQPVTFDNTIPTGFSHAPGGKKYSNQSIFCYHHYEPPALNLKSLDRYVKDGKKLGVSSILSQTFGSEQTLNRAQYWQQSWMYWIYKDYGKNWGISKLNKTYEQSNNITLNNIIKNQYGIDSHLIRTYLQRVAGKLQYSKFNPKTAQFIASYWAQISGQTILYLNKQRTYNNQYIINCYPSNQIQIIENGNFVILKFTGNQQNRKILITVSKL